MARFKIRPLMIAFPFKRKKKSCTKEEYLRRFENIMQEFEKFGDKGKLFSKLVTQLDLDDFHSSKFYEKRFSVYQMMIKTRIERDLEEDERIKIEVLVNAAKSKFLRDPVSPVKKPGEIGVIKIRKRTGPAHYLKTIKKARKIKIKGAS